MPAGTGNVGNIGIGNAQASELYVLPVPAGIGYTGNTGTGDAGTGNTGNTSSTHQAARVHLLAARPAVLLLCGKKEERELQAPFKPG